MDDDDAWVMQRVGGLGQQIGHACSAVEIPLGCVMAPKTWLVGLRSTSTLAEK